MKKNNILLKKIYFGLFMLIFLIPTCVFAEEDNITLKSNIENVRNKSNYLITYKVEPSSSNAKGVKNEPTEIVIDFSDVEVKNNILTKEAIIDFSDVVFPKTGLYTYTVYPISTSDEENLPLIEKKYQIYVQVTYGEDNSLKKNVYQFATDLDDNEKKELKYSFTPTYTYLIIENINEGKMKEVDKDVYFKYRLSINGSIGNTYEIIGQDEEITFNGKKIKTEKFYTINENVEENYIYVYLKDEQKITVGLNASGFKEIPIGTEYNITKIEGEKWETTIDYQNAIKKMSTTTAGDNYSLIINKRDYDIAKTGVFVEILPFALLIFLALILVVLLFKFKIKKENDK